MRSLITTHFVSLDEVANQASSEEGFRHNSSTMDVEPDPAAVRSARVKSRRRRPRSSSGGRSYEAFSEVWPNDGLLRRLERDAEVRHPEHRHRPPVGQRHRALFASRRRRHSSESDGGPIFVQGSMLLTQILLKAGLVDEIGG